MEANTMTLVEAVRKVEANGVKVRIGSFETFEDFLSYFNAHYKPIITQLAKDWEMETDARRFLTDDLLSAFAES